VYSFALQPEQHQPSGTCNLSRIDNTTLLLTVSNNAVGAVTTSSVYVFATNYNVLRVMSGINKKKYVRPAFRKPSMPLLVSSYVACAA
jgi:hypothetical protein